MEFILFLFFLLLFVNLIALNAGDKNP